MSNTVLLGASNVGVFARLMAEPRGTISCREGRRLVAHPTRAGVVFAGKIMTSSRRCDGVLWQSRQRGDVAAANSIRRDVATIQRIELAVTPAAPDLVYALVGGKDSGADRPVRLGRRVCELE